MLARLLPTFFTGWLEAPVSVKLEITNKNTTSKDCREKRWKTKHIWFSLKNFLCAFISEFPIFGTNQVLLFDSILCYSDYFRFQGYLLLTKVTVVFLRCTSRCWERHGVVLWMAAPEKNKCCGWKLDGGWWWRRQHPCGTVKIWLNFGK